MNNSQQITYFSTSNKDITAIRTYYEETGMVEHKPAKLFWKYYGPDIQI